MPCLVVLRHGESQWNANNRFTGWTDVDLTARGIEEAHRAGQRLRQAGFEFDIAFTSVLKRAIRTLWIVLDELDQHWVPVTKTWRLNERHYGALQGLNKTETAERLGREQVHRWRRSFDVPPPPLDSDDPRHPRFDRRYAAVPSHQLPRGESLRDTLDRLLPAWHEQIAPHLRGGACTLVVAHGNSLRALVAYLDRIAPDAIPDLRIPNGIPRVYELADDLSVRSARYLVE